MNKHKPPTLDEVRATLWKEKSKLEERVFKQAGQIGRLQGVLDVLADFVEREVPHSQEVVARARRAIKETGND